MPLRLVWGSVINNNVLGVSGNFIKDDGLISAQNYLAVVCFGNKVSATTLCQDSRVWTSMMDITPCLASSLIGAEAAAYWEANPDKIPDGSRYKPEYIAANKPEKGEFSDAQNVALVKTFCLFLLQVSSYSKSKRTCLPDVEGLCTPGVTITEYKIEETEEDRQK